MAKKVKLFIVDPSPSTCLTQFLCDLNRTRGCLYMYCANVELRKILLESVYGNCQFYCVVSCMIFFHSLTSENYSSHFLSRIFFFIFLFSYIAEVFFYLKLFYKRWIFLFDLKFCFLIYMDHFICLGVSESVAGLIPGIYTHLNVG